MPAASVLYHALIDKLKSLETDQSIDLICLHGDFERYFPFFIEGPTDRVLTSSHTAGVLLYDLCTVIENSKTPIAVIMQGHISSSGLAIALAAHTRAASSEAQIQLLDAIYGRVPCGGITQRLPRLTDGPISIDLCVRGLPLLTPQALKIGLIDVILSEVSEAAIEAFCSHFLHENQERRRTCDLGFSPIEASTFFQNIADERSRCQSLPLSAPNLVLDCLEATLLMPFEAGALKEQATWDDALGSAQSRALSYAHHAQNQYANVPEDLNVSLGQTVQHIGIVGVSISALSLAVKGLKCGFDIHLIGADADKILLFQQEIAANFAQALQEGHSTEIEQNACLKRLHGSADLASLSDCEYVIEASEGGLERRRQILTRLEDFIEDTVCLASSAGGSLDMLSKDLRTPERFVGLHILQTHTPVACIEIIKSQLLSPALAATSHLLVERFKARPIHVSSANSGMAKQMLNVTAAAVDVLLLLGVRPSKIDEALRRYGLKEGPCEMMDRIGLDHFEGATVNLLCKVGDTGRDYGRGFYDYSIDDLTDDTSHTLSLNDEMATRLIGELRDSANIPLVQMSEQDICERVLLAQANHGAKLLQNGIVNIPADIDAVLLLTGALPSWRGGVMFSADEMTPLRVLSKLRSFAAEGPDVWEPAILWEELVKNGDQISDLNNL